MQQVIDGSERLSARTEPESAVRAGRRVLKQLVKNRHMSQAGLDGVEFRTDSNSECPCTDSPQRLPFVAMDAGTHINDVGLMSAFEKGVLPPEAWNHRTQC
jgi:hypothetical protein